jgi:hypothetical protein
MRHDLNSYPEIFSVDSGFRRKTHSNFGSNYFLLRAETHESIGGEHVTHRREAAIWVTL